MSDVAVTMPSATEFEVRPEDLVIDERFKRAGPMDEEREAKLVEQLANTIERDGQLETVLVAEVKKGEEDVYVVVSGHRRRRAIVLINERRSQNGKELMKVRCKVERGDLIRKSLIINLQRKNYSAMQLAHEIKRIRDDKKWEGFAGLKKIAEYMQLDVANIRQHEKLLDAPREIQEKLEEGRIGMQGALELMEVKPEKVPKVLKKAEELQVERDRNLTPSHRAKRAKEGVKEGERIETPAIREAIKETPMATDPNKKPPLTRREILEAIEQFDSDAYGYADGATRIWVRYFVDVYAANKGTNATMIRKFDEMTAKAYHGTRPKKADEDSAKKKTAPKKTKE